MSSNTTLYFVTIVISSIGLLGWIVFLNNQKSSTNRNFLYFSLVSIIWNLSNFLVYRVNDQMLGLWFVRINILSAVWYSYFLLRLFYSFPSTTVELSKRIQKRIIPILAIVSVLTLTPLVLGRVISVDNEGHVAQITNGPAIPVFGATAVILISTAIYTLIKKVRKSTGKEKTQFQLIGSGAIITFSLYILFNLIFPTLLGNPKFISFGALFTFPFIFLTSFAILKYNLLNIKVLSTEIVVLLVLALTSVEIVSSKTTLEIVLRSILFIILLIFSYILVRSVRIEYSQREQLSILNKQLEIANDHLKELDQAKSEFVSIASHQLRTPMTGIMGYLSMMTQGDYGQIKPEHQKILVDLLAESQRMIRLINQFLNVSKIEAGKFTYTWKPTQMEDLVAHVVKEIAKPATDKGLKLTVKMPKTKLPIVQADADKIEDVVLNLIDNAIKYTAKGTIVATLSLENDLVHFRVKDSGIGIKPQDASELFSKFVRGSGIAQIHPDGSGLGLFIAKSIIDAHGGKIWTESEGEGQGSTFQFTLPLKPPPGEPHPLNAAAHVVKPKDDIKTLKDE